MESFLGKVGIMVEAGRSTLEKVADDAWMKRGSVCISFRGGFPDIFPTWVSYGFVRNPRVPSYHLHFWASLLSLGCLKNL